MIAFRVLLIILSEKVRRIYECNTQRSTQMQYNAGGAFTPFLLWKTRNSIFPPHIFYIFPISILLKYTSASGFIDQWKYVFPRSSNVQRLLCKLPRFDSKLHDRVSNSSLLLSEGDRIYFLSLTIRKTARSPYCSILENGNATTSCQREYRT